MRDENALLIYENVKKIIKINKKSDREIK